MDNDLIFMLVYTGIFFLLVWATRDMFDPIGWDKWEDIFDEIKEDLKKAIRGQ